jgi:hypothetical protein
MDKNKNKFRAFRKIGQLIAKMQNLKKFSLRSWIISRKVRNKNTTQFSWLSGRGTTVGFLILAIIGTIGLIIGEKLKKYEYVTIKAPSIMERKINQMVAGQPIAEMTPFIAQKDKKTAAYLIAIAKKESNWGKFAPQKNNTNCYNYWGYRGSYNRTASGYSCFDSPEQAVNVVGDRISDLVNKKVDTPKAMALAWKCGWDCSGHDPASVTKWVSDVNFYYKKIYN